MQIPIYSKLPPLPPPPRGRPWEMKDLLLHHTVRLVAAATAAPDDDDKADTTRRKEFYVSPLPLGLLAFGQCKSIPVEWINSFNANDSWEING